MFGTDIDSERATSIEDYQNTCTNFIYDLSKDYKDWVDRYKLDKREEGARKQIIDELVKKSSDFIFNYGDTIKKIDIIMNDCINKMAENTAGYPFKFDILVNNLDSRYVFHDKNNIKLNLKAFPRSERQIRITNYDKDNVFLFSSSTPVEFNYSTKSFESSDLLDDYILLKIEKFDKFDVISITIKVEEVEVNRITESRGFTSLIIIK